MRDESRSLGKMGPKACWLFLLLALVAVVPGTAEIVGDSDAGLQATNFDYFIFAQLWPGTYCSKYGSCCDGLVGTESFSIHGVWPQNEDNSYPSCCSGPAFDQSKVDELTDLLQQYWPSLSCSSPTQCSGKKTGTFWQHEWEKHGTCSYPIIPDEATYFVVGLNLRMKYDVSAILRKAGIVPSSTATYSTSVVKSTIEDAVGVQINMSCKSKTKINEVWICFTKDLKIRDCGTVDHSCSKTLQIPPLRVKASKEEM